MQWSPMGTYFATVDRHGAAVWGGGGSTDFNRLMCYAHPQVRLIDFSPGEKYLVTYSSHEPCYHDYRDQVVIYIFEVITRKLRRDFSAFGETSVSGASWFVFKWAGGKEDKYFARILADGVISIYETDEFSVFRNIEAVNVGDISWSPTEPILAFWVLSLEGPKQTAKVNVALFTEGGMEVREGLHNPLHDVRDCQLYWQSNGEYLAFKVDRGRTKNLDHTTFVIFQIKVPDIPCIILKLKNKFDEIIAFAWEPNGRRFAIIHGDSSSTNVSFYLMVPGLSKVTTLTTLKSKRANVFFLVTFG